MLDKSEMTVRVPSDMIQIIEKMTGGKSIDEKVRLSLAIGMFVDRTVTLERAAEFAGKPLDAFEDSPIEVNIYEPADSLGSDKMTVPTTKPRMTK